MSKRDTTTPPRVAVAKPARLIHSNKLFELMETPLFVAHVPVLPAVPEATPELQWRGAGIPWNIYCQLTSFMYWSYKETKGEAQARLAYNTETREWHVFVMPQERSTGLTTTELETHPDRNAAQAILRVPGVLTAGTAHHHCAVSAFQSGVDKADEDRQDGLHITFGKLDEDALDTHARVTMRGHTFTTSLEKWIVFPEIPEILPASMHADLIKYWLSHPDKVDFPEEWKTRLIPPTVTYANGKSHGAYFGNGNARNFHGQQNFDSYAGGLGFVLESELPALRLEDEFAYDTAQRLVNEATTQSEMNERVSSIRAVLPVMWKLAVEEQQREEWKKGTVVP
jgi:hypothetical protein